ncbi:ABC transporter substrate-binding protein [Curtobacterium ammoniigenes]|uniref:ABC transporter substrate-binding protein n=1 Tax=Curtobacterium ammoniigenes TaxID=395387 RepID=UPI00082CE896|nr:ABC transporter substrate-binding protein [Curtobacterium ammoniigenes]
MTKYDAVQLSRRGFLGGFAGLVAVGALAGCTSSGTTTAASGPGAAFGGPYKKAETITVFDGLANYQGVQKGWFGHLISKKFNLSMNVIAPNVSGGGDTLYNTRVAAGNLGDLIVTDRGQKFDQLIQGGLLFDFSKYYAQMKNAKEYDAAVQKLNSGKKGIYGIPVSVTSLKPTTPSEGLDPTFGPYMRWDYYKELGYPTMKTLEDMIPVLKEMQQAHPKADNGKATYAFSLFKDWDGNMMTAAKQPACFYGFDEMGFVLAKADGSKYESIIDSDSHYVRSLKLYATANQQGLVDPDSPTQNYSTMYAKFQNGQTLFACWPWLAKPAYNTTANLAAGKGFEFTPINDLDIFSYGASIYGGTQLFSIGSKAADPERIAAYLDWLYSPEGIYASGAQTGAAPGPEGLTWQLGSDKKPELTALGKQALLGGGATVPASWGGGKFSDGVSALNATTVLPIDVDPSTGLQYEYAFWPSYQKANSNPVINDWKSKMGNVDGDIAYLQKKHQLLVAPGSGYAAPADPPQISTIRNQAKAIIVQSSWKMSLATSENEFNSLLKDMQSTVKGLGYATVLSFDMDNAKAQNEARLAVKKKFG